MNTSVQRPTPRGFTLIELMVVVVVVSILAAVALPSYFGSVRKSRRADAVNAINQVAQAQERWRANNPTYTATLSSTGLNIPNPTSGYYTLAASVPSGSSGSQYSVTATAAGAQLKDTACTSLTLTVVGGQLTYTATPAANSNKCWNR